MNTKKKTVKFKKKATTATRASAPKVLKKVAAKAASKTKVKVAAKSKVMKLPPESAPKKRSKRTVLPNGRAALLDMMEAKLIPSKGCRIHSKYGKKVLKGLIKRNGKVQYNKTEYETISQAAIAARGDQPGGNGWMFWKIDTKDGAVPIGSLRDKLAA